jgi:hypothetical protein
VSRHHLWCIGLKEKSGVLAFARILRVSFLFVKIGLEARFTDKSVRQSVRDAYISYDVDTSFKM